MSRRKAAEHAFGKALALWEAPEGAGEARVCVASTFTFDAAFFETECLGRFLGMDSHPSESDAVSYMVEREEKLAAARLAVLADRLHARDKESLRWDVLGVLVSGAIQHSKISLLAWSNYVRVIIGSGNLTEPGYRKNLEVFGTLELSRKDGGDRATVLRVLDFLGELVSASVGTDRPNAPKRRATEALESVRALIASWPQVDSANPTLILGGPDRAVLPQLREVWGRVGPPRSVYVVSPFFDTDGKEAVSALLKILAERRPREICFDVRAEDTEDGRIRVFAPKAMVDLARAQADVEVRRVLPEQMGELRDLHAKMIYLHNDDWCMAMMGSSNFTRAGLGARGRANFEANLAYRLRISDSETKVLDAVWPATAEEALDVNSDQLIWDPLGEEEEGAGASIPLPAAFQEASVVPGQPSSLAITLSQPLPKEWEIRIPKGAALLSSSRGAGAGEHVIAWEGTEVPFVLEVTWAHASGNAVANWPVNVSNPAALPPPEALRSLTLEELLQVLASTRPMAQAVAEVFAKRKTKKEQGDANLDPLQRFESKSYLLRRTKRLAAALERLRDRLERPASSREAFDWRLFGPVGPLALAEGYMREAGIAGEAKFCLAEIALSLHRVRAECVAVDGLPRAVIVKSLKKAIKQLVDRAATLPPVPEIDRYAKTAFEEAAQ